MSVVLLALLLATSPSAAASSSAALSPDQEVEAWDPITTPEPSAPRPPRDIHDDGAQAVAAVFPVAGGVVVGSLAAYLVLVAGSVLPAGTVPAAIVATLAFAAAPAVAVALFVPDLPAWTPWLTSLLVPVGGVALGAAMFGASYGLVMLTRGPDDDCGLCGVGGLVVILGTPAAGVLGAVAGGLAATTMAAYAAHE